MASRLAPPTAPSLRLLVLCSLTTPVTRFPRRAASRRARPPLPLSSSPGQFHAGEAAFRLRYRSAAVDPRPDGEGRGFNRAVSLFNDGDYHGCHDFLEELWNGAEEPIRTLIHGILQCAVGLHHLFNQNHRGAMMELGEGVCKLRKMGFDGGPFLLFEREISEVLEFLYQTQKELAACTNDLCLAMDGSERSYQLLGSFAAGQPLYSLDLDSDDGVSYISFNPEDNYSVQRPARVKIPTLNATEEHLKACEY